MTEFSVCMSVYKNDSPLFLKQAIDSIMGQSAVPTKVILIVDGPIPKELQNVIDGEIGLYAQIIPYYLKENVGLGKALKYAVEESELGIIARMDSDDISLPGRFEKQLKYLEEHQDIDVVGGQMTEFVGSSDNIVGKRVVPLDHNDIANYMKSRCGMNHVTVMFRKDAVLKSGNYQDWFWNEDYYLWVRMLAAGCRFANLPDVLVNVRSGKDQYARRGGDKYFHSEYGIQKYMLEHNMIKWPRFVFNVFGRWCVQVAMPNWLRGWMFRTFFRK